MSRIRAPWLWGIALFVAGCSCSLFESGEEDAGPRDLGVGDPCVDDRSCRSGLVCGEDGACAPSGQGLEGSICTLTGDCMEGLYCGPRRTCVPAGDGEDGADCQRTADCAPGLLCSVEGFGFRCRPAGDGDLGDECTDDRSCLAGLRCVAAEGMRRCQNPPVFGGDGGVGGMAPPTLPRWAGETCEEDDGPPTAYFHVPRGDASDRDFYRLPFPNDVRRTADGLDLSGHPSPGDVVGVDVLRRHLEASETDLDGFATNPVVFFRFSRPYHWDDVTGDRLWLVDLSPDSPDYGRNLGRSWYTTAGPISRYICPSWLSLRRGHGGPLRPGTTYAAILLRGVRTSVDEGQEPFARAADLDALLADAAPSEPALADAWDAYAPLRDWLGTEDAPGAGDVLNVAVFTTQSATDLPSALRAAVRAEPAPTLRDVTVCDDGVESPCADGDRRTCGAASDDYWEIHARIELPQFQQGTPPFETPEDGGGIRTDASGAPVIARTETVCMVMTVPKEAPPAEGFGVAIYAHGTGGAYTAPVARGLAADFATGAAPGVTVAIDMPLHGTRRGGSTREPDGLVFNFTNPRAARDNYLQGAADLMSLVYWAEGYTWAAADAPGGFDVTFDPSRVVLWGHSQGGTHAQLMVAHEPGVSALVLSGAGGDLTESLLTKTEPVDIAAAVPLALLDPDGSGGLVAGDQHPALALLQAHYERVDPVNYGRHLWREPVDGTGRHAFVVYGLDDRYSTERTMAAYARSASLPHVAPELVDVGLGETRPPPVSDSVRVVEVPFTVGLRQYEPAPGDDGHFVATRVAQARADAVRFVRQALAGATPTIGE
ncbi:MAG TPA: hypothetical protein RMH99_31090 [Sandaracinaceae bacterium LLY-WYZ-13_1]|nr:hypothetical protein [Sandaracinaceae bacterium LLY-WYZ-13_1]